jgi:hypothetical protein
MDHLMVGGQDDGGRDGKTRETVWASLARIIHVAVSED